MTGEQVDSGGIEQVRGLRAITTTSRGINVPFSGGENKMWLPVECELIYGAHIPKDRRLAYSQDFDGIYFKSRVVDRDA